jgi:YD repeat-containing protein
MKTKHAHTILFLITILAFTYLNLTSSSAETINYIYDDLHRLIRVENTSNGSAVEYQYDAVGNRTQRTVTNAGIQLRVTVRKDAQSTLQGVNTYLFNDSGSYLGQAQVTAAGGVATFNVSPGTYNVRADYLGYQFWTGTVQVSGSTSIDLVIPHHTVNIAVNSTFQGTSTPLSGVNAYVFTPDGSYLGLSQQTGTDGRVSFSLPDRDYKVRADYLGQQYFSAVFHAQDAAVNIPMADAEITVIQGNQPVNGVNVYVFTPDGSYLGISGVTDTSGKVTFRLPVASYKFRADYLGSQYWSSVETLTANQLKQITINTGGGQFSLTVLKDTSLPLTGVSCYAFNVGGSYLGLSGVTSSSGQVTYNLSDGNYKFRIDYLGYQFWSDVVTVPTAMSVTKTIPHQSVNITVTGSLAGNNQPKANVPVYLFNPSGSYLGVSATTDSSGRASFNVPQQAFKVRADYLGQQYWSDVFTWADKTIVIPEGTAHVHVTMAGQDVPSVPVYVFNSANSYLGISGTTDVTGAVEFRLPAGSYKFRADYQGGQYWATATINQDVVNTVELSTGG